MQRFAMFFWGTLPERLHSQQLSWFARPAALHGGRKWVKFFINNSYADRAALRKMATFSANLRLIVILITVTSLRQTLPLISRSAEERLGAVTSGFREGKRLPLIEKDSLRVKLLFTLPVE
ncbi:MAG TPA: hypothetical protein VNO70_07420 [Blastocatellia bacterium]|nr:hypothetical protein [Blastocatellia bacterium]